MERRQFLAGLAVAQAPQTPPPPKATITSSVMLWTLKGSLEEKLEAAARSGVQSVELVAEYAEWSDADLERYRKLCRSFRLGTDALAASPNWAKRPVSLLDPAQRDGFLSDLRKAIEVARKLETPQIIVMSGNTIPNRGREEQRASLLEGLKRAGDLAAAASLDVILEPLNSLVNHKGYFMDTCVEGLKIVKQADNPHVKLLFDIYHEQVQAGNVIRTLTEAAPHVAVYHVADNPGRHEPGTGELNWTNIYKAIRKTGFSGYVCMEFQPVGEQVAALTKALNDFRAAAA